MKLNALPKKHFPKKIYKVCIVNELFLAAGQMLFFFFK